MRLQASAARDGRRLRGMEPPAWTPSATAIVDELGGKYCGTGRWMARCPAHEDRTPSLSIRDADGLVLVHCFGGCTQGEVIDALRARGLWPERTERPTKRQGPTPTELEREAFAHAARGRLPDRLPPYTRELPRVGPVRILIAGENWPRRPVPALVLPPRHPAGAYRWPVRHRHVELIDLATNPPPGYFHYGEYPWQADPWQWGEVRRDWLRAFAVLLIRDNGAASVRAVSEALGESVLFEGVRDAA